jgi:hypothetical protein
MFLLVPNWEDKSDVRHLPGLLLHKPLHLRR